MGKNIVSKGLPTRILLRSTKTKKISASLLRLAGKYFFDCIGNYVPPIQHQRQGVMTPCSYRAQTKCRRWPIRNHPNKKNDKTLSQTKKRYFCRKLCY